MKQLMYHIIRLALALLPVMLTVASATAQIRTVYQGETIELSVVQEGNNTYTWDLYNDPSVNFATVDGNALPNEAFFVAGNTGPNVQVTWLEAGIYFYRVLTVDEEGCTNHLKVGMLEVLESLPTADLELKPNEICIGDPGFITVTLTGNPAWEITLEAVNENGDVTDVTRYTVGENDPNPFEIQVNPTETTIYRVTELKDKYGNNLDPAASATLTVHPLPVNSRIYKVTQ
ncbi:hypothetical protein [Sunxiuqinia sp. sy24]|uniref:hypothetical protein n=1 Tax=Sunxiuqinia sp. sy24 TaxID=3461495 RepID=UPI0040464D30